MDGPSNAQPMAKVRFLLTIATVVTLAAPPANAFWWGLTEEEQQICESRAAIQSTDFSARQAYERCKKGIKTETREKNERKSRQEAEAAAQEAAKQAVIKKLTPRIERRCLAYLPKIKSLDEEMSGENLQKYLKEWHSFHPRMREMYGGNFERLKKSSNPFDYPDYVMEQFPWIKRYWEVRAKVWVLLLKMVGNGVKREELTSMTWLNISKYDGCSKTAKSIAECFPSVGIANLFGIICG